MSLTWQDFLALAVVALAAVHLAHRGWRTVLNRRRGACGGCSTCAGGDEPPLVQVESLSGPGREEALAAGSPGGDARNRPTGPARL